MQGVGKAWGEPHTCQSPEELQRRLEQMDHIQRAEYPHDAGRSRPETYPALAHSGREYSWAWERLNWSLERVQEGLAGIVVRRRVDRGGSVSIYNRNYYVGERYRSQTVLILFDPLDGAWVCTDERDQQLRRWPAPEICRQRILNLDVSQRRDR
jgi:hypothetical protein